MRNGGYKIVDFREKAISAVSTTIPGIYEEIENSYGKAILISGCKIGTEEINDFYTIPRDNVATPTEGEPYHEWVCKSDNFEIHISDTDGVTVSYPDAFVIDFGSADIDDTGVEIDGSFDLMEEAYHSDKIVLVRGGGLAPSYVVLEEVLSGETVTKYQFNHGGITDLGYIQIEIASNDVVKSVFTEVAEAQG